MCDQCLSHCVYFGSPLEGFILARSRRGGSDSSWPEGYWGLIEMNDPTFVWDGTPALDTDGEIDFPTQDFIDSLVCNPESGHRLVEAAIKSGWSQEKGALSLWLWEHIYRYLLTAQPEPDGDDPLPNAGVVNYSISNPLLDNSNVI